MATDDGTPPAQDPQHSGDAADAAGRGPARRPTGVDDDVALAGSVASAGLNAFGCVFVELWVIAEDGTALFRPEGGQWMVRTCVPSCLPARPGRPPSRPAAAMSCALLV